VLILEGMAQVGSILAYISAPQNIGDRLVYFAGLDKVRFRRVVRPGDQLIFKLEMLRLKTKIAKMAGKAYVNDELATEAELMATFA